MAQKTLMQPKLKQPKPKVRAECSRCGRLRDVATMAKHQRSWGCLTVSFVRSNETVRPPGMEWAVFSSPTLVRLGDIARVETYVGTRISNSQMTPWAYGPEWLVALETALFHTHTPTAQHDAEVVAEYLASSSQQQRDGFSVEISLLNDVPYGERRHAYANVLRKFASDAIPTIEARLRASANK